MDAVRLRHLGLTARDQPAAPRQPGPRWMLQDDLVSASRTIRSAELTVGDWLRTLRHLRGSSCLAADGAHSAQRRLGQRLRAKVA